MLKSTKGTLLNVLVYNKRCIHRLIFRLIRKNQWTNSYNFSACVQTGATLLTCELYLSNHAVPHVVNFLPVLAIGDEVEVVGELDVPGNLLENINAEALAALLDVGPSCCAVTVTNGCKSIIRLDLLIQKDFAQSYATVHLPSALSASGSQSVTRCISTK